jgi:hypothetical protein
MSVYIDDMRMYATVGTLSARWSHLTADTKEELHAFAERLGMRRSWFQDKPNGLWHYDVTDNKRKRAIAMGALCIHYGSAEDFDRVWQRPGREGVTDAD